MRIFGLFLALLGVLTVGCSNAPQTSGTSTHWLSSCSSTAECGGDSTCVCGICTQECTDDEDCSPGTCGSELTALCSGKATSSLCVPLAEEGSCAELPVPEDNTLSATAPTPACATPGALLCESFDAPLSSDYAVWSTDTTVASLQECLVYQGAGAFRFRSPTYGAVQTQMRLSEPISSGPLYARFYAYVPSWMTVPTYFALFELWHQEGSSDGKISVELIAEDTLELQVIPNESTHPSSPRAFPRDQWVCLELGLDVAAQDGAFSLSVNGTSVIEATDVVTLPQGPISIAVVEGLPSEDSTGAELALDELVVATEPIGCL